MKNVKLLAAAGMLSLVSFASFAHPVSVTADTLDSAEAKIATIAKEQGASYHITEAYTGKLPFELPSSMDAVLRQKSDMPHDSENPLFDIGFGLAR